MRRLLMTGTRRLLVALMLGLALVVPTARAQAYSGAFFHVVSSGNRGADVHAVQHLLQSHGFTTAADGAFGSGTASTVQAFQRSRGLTADGAVGAATWGRLVVTLRSGASGAAVRALQVELNEKRNAGLVGGTIPVPVLSAVYPDHKRRLLRPESPWPQVLRVFGGVQHDAVKAC